MNDVLFTPLRLNELETLIEKSIERVLLKINKQTQPIQNQQTKFGDLDWFINTHPKKPAKATVYSNISNGKIPKSLMHKPEGTKNVLFYKERVLDWINQGFPNDYAVKTDEDQQSNLK